MRATEEYAFLVNAVHHHKEMLFHYGHSLEKEREQLKKAASTAHYVGLSMPDAYDHDAHDARAKTKGGGDGGEGK